MVMTAATTRSNPSLTLSIPTPDDFHGLANLQTRAFEHERLWSESEAEALSNNYKRYCRYYKDCPLKLTHCRIIKFALNEGDDDESEDAETIVAACQLQLRRPQQTRTTTSDDSTAEAAADVFVEWIACHPAHMNKGLGSVLLEWAATFAKEQFKASKLTLYVIRANSNAFHWYQRRGFVLQKRVNRDTAIDKLLHHVANFLCGKFTVLTMEKDLSEIL